MVQAHDEPQLDKPFLAPITVNYMYKQKNLDTTKSHYSKQNYFASPLALCYIKAPIVYG